MNNDHIKDLGIQMGLYTHTVEQIKSSRELVGALLRKEDNVTKKRGDPLTWGALVKGLRAVGQNGIAGEIEEKKCRIKGR